MTKEEINKTLVEAEGGCWHEWQATWGEVNYGMKTCKKCHMECDRKERNNPDFSEWANFGRLLKIADRYGKVYPMMDEIIKILKLTPDTDQIPTLVATELAKILKEKDEKG